MSAIAVLAPIIEEPVFECEVQVRVSSLAPKTTVVVEDRSNGAELGRTVARGGSAVVRVQPVASNDEIVAVARLNGAEARSVTVVVQALPAGLTPALHIPIYTGGHCISLSNRMLRGTRIETLSGSTSLGSSPYFYPYFHQPLQRALLSNDVVHVSSEICSQVAVSPNATPLRPIGAWPYEEKLPPLSLERPLACQRSIAVSGIIPGATVTTLVNGASAVEACIPWDSVILTVDPALQLGDQVEVFQQIEGTLESDRSAARVERMPELAAPLIHPVFAGDRILDLDLLVRDVTVDYELIRSGTKIVEASAHFNESGRFDLGNICEPDDVVRAKQSICGLHSPWAEIRVGKGPESLPPPGLPEPLQACVDRVSVTFFQRAGQPREGFLDGATIRLYANGIAISPPVRADSGNFEVPDPNAQRTWGRSQLIETLPLVEAWVVEATQSLGGITSPMSPPVVVTRSPELPGPTHIEATPCDGVVRVDGWVSGARTGVFSGKLMIGSGYTGYAPPWQTGKGTAYLLVHPNLVWAGAELEAAQLLCQSRGTSLRQKVTGALRVDLQSSMVVGTSQTATVQLVNAHQASCPIREGRQATYTAKVLDPNPGVTLSPGQGVLHAGESKFSVQIQAVSEGDNLCEFEVQDYGKEVAWLSATKAADPPAMSQVIIEWDETSEKCASSVNGVRPLKAAFIRNLGTKTIEARVYVQEETVGAIGPPNSYTMTVDVGGGRRQFLNCSLKDIQTNPEGGWVIGVQRTFMIVSAKYL